MGSMANGGGADHLAQIVREEIQTLRKDVSGVLTAVADVRVSVARMESGLDKVTTNAAAIEALAERIRKLEDRAGELTGTTRAVGSVGKWIAGIAASLIVAATIAVVTYLVSR
jgi:hypothetical protein